MELLLVPVPLFDKYMAVESYLLQYRFSNQGNLFVSGSKSPLIQALEQGGVEAIAGGNPVFIPITVEILPQLLEEYTQPGGISVFLLESAAYPLQEEHRRLLLELRKKGYLIAAAQRDRFVDDDDLLRFCDYVVFSGDAMTGSDRKAHVIRYKKFFKNLKAVATGLTSQEEFDRAAADGFHLFEGMFYRVPVTAKDRELSPIKSNLLRLLNLVRDEQFEFRDIAEVVRQDPALSYSLMRFINSPYLGIRYKVKSIQQAVTILGQIEVRKWVTAAVFKALGSDRPSELTRISLVRAKFAENMAGMFGLADDSSSLFLMGLFSALDVMLDTDMETALAQVMVSDDISTALIRREGRFRPVMEFVIDYERADWEKVIAGAMVSALEITDVLDAYLDAVGWYHELISTAVRLRNDRDTPGDRSANPRPYRSRR